MSAFVMAAYALTFALVGGYALTVWLRLRAVAREEQALDQAEPPGGGGPA